MSAAKLSINMIHLGDPGPLLLALDSAYGALYRDGDEAVIIDTGSIPAQRATLAKRLKQFPGARLINANLAVDYTEAIRKYLGEAALAEFTAHQKRPVGVLDFAAAREMARKESRNPLIFWLDSDDVLAEPKVGEFRAAIDKHLGCENPQLDALFLPYEYSFADDGTCTTVQRRERVFFRDRYIWAGRCHETAIPRPGIEPRRVGSFDSIGAKIVHTEARKPHRISDIRNYVILRTEFEESQGRPDPRTVFYLGNAARGLSRHEECLQLYKSFDALSGSVDDRFAAAYYVAATYLEMRRPFDSLDAYFKCIQIKPADPRGYFGVARVYAALRRCQESVHWYEIGRGIPMPPHQIFSYDPTHVHYHPHILAGLAYKELGAKDKMLACAERMLAGRPRDKQTQQLYQEFRGHAAAMELTAGVGAVVRHLPHGGPNGLRVAQKICAELGFAVEPLESQGVGVTEPADTRPLLPEIVIMCGPTGEPWGPGSVETGIGGSEKMVILLARALQASGRCRVSVYADVPPTQRGLDSAGVVWRHWSELDRTRPRHAVVAWRNPAAAMLEVPARFRMVWNHDLQDPGRYTKHILQCVDFVQVQSDFHSRPLRGVVPAEKLWVARNAVAPFDARRFAGLPARDPKRVLYCSSPDRGLLTAAHIVEEARKIDPEITMVVCYGVTPWARKAFAIESHRPCPELGREICMDLYEREVFAALDRVKATVLHRVGFDKMAALQRTSGVWLYPTRFGEISCMAAMEAQQHGCVPLCTRHAALAETILPEAEALAPALLPLPEQGDVPEAFIQDAARKLVEAVKVAADAPARAILGAAAELAFDVGALAEQWLEKLNLPGPRPAAADTAAQAPVGAAGGTS